MKEGNQKSFVFNPSQIQELKKRLQDLRDRL
jgi:hypothetical protein